MSSQVGGNTVTDVPYGYVLRGVKALKFVLQDDHFYAWVQDVRWFKRKLKGSNRDVIFR